MNDELALLRAIVESPDDTLLRLVYADWCEEHGRDAHAALIRGQCFLDPLLRIVHDPEYDAPGPDARYLSCRQLEPDLYHQLLGPMAELMQDPPTNCLLRRGFIETINLIGQGTVWEWITMASVVLNRHPVQCLQIFRSYDPTIPDQGRTLPADLVQSLIAVPGVEFIPEFDFSGYILGVAGAEVLLASSLAPTRLRLRHRDIPDELLAQFQHRFGPALLLVNDRADDIPF